MSIKAIEYAWIDPWTSEFCAGARMAYSKRRMEKGFFRRQILATKTLAQRFCGLRKPKLVLRIHR